MFRIIVIALIFLSSFGFVFLGGNSHKELHAAVNCFSTPSHSPFSGMGMTNKEKAVKSNIQGSC